MATKAEALPYVFLDTSIQVARVLGVARRRQHIEEVITNEMQACTSSYVYMEYQRTVIADFAYVHQILQKTSNWGDAIARVATGNRPFRPRSLVRVNQILGETANRSYLDIEKGLLFLQTYLDYRLHDLFWNRVVPLRDNIQCDLLTLRVTQQVDSSYQVADSCRKEAATCSLPDFLTEKRPQLKAIAEHLHVRPGIIKDQTRVEQLLSTIQRNPQSALGQASCWPLGDIIILLHVPSDCAVWSFDSDFAPICQALGLRIFSVNHDSTTS